VRIIDETPTDADLVARVRAGDTDAYGELWTRHIDVARGLARRITSRDPDDLIGESYARILTAIQAGRGPDTAFRPYLMSTIRRINIDNARRYQSRVVPTDSPEVLDTTRGESSEDVAVRRAEGSSALAAWQSLPAETRELLWDLVVMDETPARLSGKLGMSPNAVASRARRARERLRQAYLTQLVTSDTDPECQLIRRDLGAYVRGNMGATRRETVDEHLETCTRCRSALADLRSVDDMIRLRVVPFLPVVAVGAAGELSAGGALATAASKAVTALKPQFARIPAFSGPTGFVTAAAGLAAAVVITAVAITGHHDGSTTVVKPTAPTTSSAPSVDRPRAATQVAIVSAIAEPRASAAPRPSGPPTPPAVAAPVPAPVAASVAAPAPRPEVTPTPASTPQQEMHQPPRPAEPAEPAEPADHTDPDDAPTGSVTLVLTPNATTQYLAKLRAPEGWVITAVSALSDHPSGRNSQFPTRSFVGFVEPGPLEVALVRTPSSESDGSLDYEFVDRGGKLDRGERSLT
jgi:RNA polymerase sigma factor (sigma-70 family)